MIAFSKEIQSLSFVKELNFGSFINDIEPANKTIFYLCQPYEQARWL